MNFATTPYTDFEPKVLVERFSWDIESNPRSPTDSEGFDQLRADFIDAQKASKRNNDEIRRIEEHFRSTRPNDEKALQEVQEGLLDAVKGFRQLVPGKSSDDWLPTCWDDVEKAVQEVQSQWDAKVKDTRIGRTKQWLRKMCDGLDSHSSALKLIPSESLYTSLIAGSVTMVIKASANHTSITESFAQGIVSINDAASTIQNSQVYSTPSIQQLVMRLYTAIFSYLMKFMKWYTDRSTKRLLRSFNENLGKLFNDDLEKVKSLASLLCQQIQLNVSGDVRISKLMLEEINGNVRHLMRLRHMDEAQPGLQTELQTTFRVDLHSHFQEAKKELLREMANQFEDMFTHMMIGEGTTDLLTQQAAFNRGLTPEMAEQGHAMDVKIRSRSPSRVRAHQRGDDIRLHTCHFEDYFDSDNVFPFPDEPLPTLADSTFVMRLKHFTTTEDSQILYVHTRFDGTGQTQLQKSAGAWISLARRSEFPVISHFCQLSSDDPPRNRTRESMELSGLVYSLIRQAVTLLPAELDQKALSIDEERISSLDGTLRTWGQAVGLLRDLLGLIHLPVLMIVIDGLTVLEYDAEHITLKIRQLVKCLQSFVRTSNSEGRVIKLFFTTAGLSPALSEEIDPADIIMCGPAAPKGIGGRRKSRQMVMF